MFHMVRPSDGHTTQAYGNGGTHAGTDYAYTDGEQVFPDVWAAAAGTVLFAGDSRTLPWPNLMYLNPDFDRSDARDESAGNYIIIEHVGGQLTGYAHLQSVDVVAGQHVAARQRLGTVGETGNSYGKHLHFDYVPDRTVVHVPPMYGRTDPEPLFTEQEDELSAEFERDVRAELADRRRQDHEFQRDVRAELAAHRVMLTADRGLTQEQLLDTIKEAVIKVEISAGTP